MAPSVLGFGISHASPIVPKDNVEGVQKALEFMEKDMNASPYDWEMFYVEPNMDFEPLIKKLREREWDVAMVGMGLRIAPPLTVFFEKLVNTLHKELPNARIAFNTSIESTQEAVKRTLELEL
ncbi:hypothetical protein BDV96DRAFT_649375 [Lophiotrema nucula]|uniref:Uncharacterized protein n=1 Tax=Lophiotrema nucula TaxID=690887 RepID=A0A6A5Z0Z9_9PLEO|nr:hypothetical protein BDV96DRAFT_649375 [Lophiotrema nucula]